MLFEEFQDCHHGRHLGYWNWTNLAILNLHVTPMPPTKFGFSLTYHLGADTVWRFLRWPPWGPSWIMEQYDFSNSESLSCFDASHQVSAQSNLQFGKRNVWRFSRWPTWPLSWIFEWNDFSNSKSPCDLNAKSKRNNFTNSESLWAPILPIMFWLNATYDLRKDVVWTISRWPSWISEQKMSPIKFQLNTTYGSGDVENGKS